MALASDNILGLLAELNDALVLEDAKPVDWVVCGGAALALLDLIRRTTRDVDVLCDWGPTGVEVIATSGFTDSVVKAIQRVAIAHPELQGSGQLWVNLGPRKIVEFGLPEGFETRLTVLRIGARLTLHLLGRADLIALKLFAAADDMGRRQHIHLDDLRAMEPTEKELEPSARWVERMPDPQYRIRAELKNVLQELGHEGLAQYICL